MYELQYYYSRQVKSLCDFYEDLEVYLENTNTVVVLPFPVTWDIYYFFT